MDAIANEQDREFRLKVESQRGIQRDENGKIIRTKEWLESHIEYLTQSIEENKIRILNAKAEIKERKKQLTNLHKDLKK